MVEGGGLMTDQDTERKFYVRGQVKREKGVH